MLVAKRGILHQLRPADLHQHPLGHALRRGRQADPVSVLRPVDVARRGIGRAAAAAHLDLAGEPVVGGLRPQHREQWIEQRQVEHLARAAVDLDLAQRHQHRAIAVQRRHAVGEIHRRQHRLAVGKAVHRGETGVTLDQRAEARLVAIAPVLAPAGNAQNHQLRVDRAQLGRRHPHVFHHARPEALDHDRSRPAELAHDGAAGVRAQVERHALLVAAIDLPGGLDVLHLPRAQGVAFRRFDLDHLGAEIRELQGEHVARDQTRQVDDADPVQRSARVRREGFLCGAFTGHLQAYLCHPERSEGSLISTNQGSLATLGMTIIAKRQLLRSDALSQPTCFFMNSSVRSIAFFDAAASNEPRSSQWKP